MRHGRPLILAVSLAAVIVLGGVAVWAQLAATRTIDRVHRADRVKLQSSLSTLTTEYLQFTALATKNAADSAGFTMRPGDRADRSALRHLVTASSLTSYGAALSTTSGTPLTSYSRGVPLPAPNDPGYAPLRRALAAGQAGVSSLMHAGTAPLVAIAVPVQQQGQVAGLLLTYADVSRWPLQGYNAALHLGPGAMSYVLDSTASIVAAADPSRLGHRLTGLPAVVYGGGTGLASYRSNGVDMVASYGPAADGWTAVTVQPASGYSGTLHAEHRRQTMTLIALLTITALLLGFFHFKRQQALARLAEERLYDPLTGLAQRRLLDLRLPAALARQRRHGTNLALVYCDLDGFKGVNDRYGHKVGDELLVVVARRLRDAVRSDDFAVRIGGDEFVLLLESTTLDSLDGFLQRLRLSVGQLVSIAGHDILPSISVGAAVLVGAGEVPDVMHEADLAMYHAKRSGIGQHIEVFGASDTGHATDQKVPLPRATEVQAQPTR